MAPKLYLFITALPLLLPRWAHSMPAPCAPSAGLDRRQLDPALTTPTALQAPSPSLAASALPALASTDPAATESSVPFLLYPGGALPLSPLPSPVSSSPAAVTPPSAPAPAPAPAPDLSTSPDASTSALGLASASAPGPLLMAYYPDWVSSAYPPEKIDFGRFDWIDFAFAVPDGNFALAWDGADDAPDTLRRLVLRAHASGKHVKLSVGGWTGSR